ncbi:MAG: hypothetical protein QNJ02_08275 [Desulfobacterales bacterium]|nr:hypothetical protein [Desulfobacterales bacterium]MDJ0875252.1 hypothetical protein [Desulfobacterales bacterium]
MHHDFIEDLLEALDRVIQPDRELLRDLLIFNGMPEDTQNLRYLSYNRQQLFEGDQTRCFSVAAVINNRRAAQWRLTGYREKLSQIVFNSRWTRSPLDIFLIRLRCQAAVIDILETAAARYTLVGIMQIEAHRSDHKWGSKRYQIYPVLGVPGLDATALATIEAFEQSTQIERNRV